MLTSSAAGLIRKLEGDFENILVRDPKTRVAAHIQIPTGENARRVVVAMPAGKSALCFETTRSVGWTLDDNVVSFAEENGQGGVIFTLAAQTAELSIPLSTVLLNHTLMARFGTDPENKNENLLRNLLQSAELAKMESELDMSLADLMDRGVVRAPVWDASRRRVTFTRRSWGGKNLYRLELSAGPACQIREAGGNLHVFPENPADGKPLRLTIRASTDFERPTPMPFNELVNETGRELAARDPFFATSVRQFEFLSYREKFLAGSWNFLSYFGRDTLIALRLMWPVLSRQAKQTGIQSVVNEIGPQGIVNVTDEWTDDRTTVNAVECFFREHASGNLAGARQIMRTILEGIVPEHPFFDVLDQTFLFPAAAAHWFKETDDAVLKQWLLQDHKVLGRAESNLATLLRNWNYILNSAEPYLAAWQDLRASHPDLSPRQVIETHREEFKITSQFLVPSIAGAANWRDTYTLPWHFRSEDINVNLLPMAIEGIRDMMDRARAAGFQAAMTDLSGTHSLQAVRAYLETPARFDAAMEAWNWDRMREHFRVRRTAQEIRRDFKRYAEGLQNGDATWGDRERGLRELHAMLKCRECGVSVSEFLHENRVPETVKDGIEFTALLLDTEGHPLPLVQSDDVFLLLFGHPTLEQFRKIVRPLILAYPFGLGFLDDELGFAITHALYSPRDNPALKDTWKNAWIKFGPDEYHGRSAWPWVLFALISGTRDQVLRGIDENGIPGSGVLPEDITLFERILEKMKSSLARLGPLATSEVFKYSPAREEGRVWQAEPMGISTPIQLWSAAPAHLLLDQALERIRLVRHHK